MGKAIAQSAVMQKSILFMVEMTVPVINLQLDLYYFIIDQTLKSIVIVHCFSETNYKYANSNPDSAQVNSSPPSPKKKRKKKKRKAKTKLWFNVG